MPINITRLLEKRPVETSAPCRLDMGGTLDIKTIHLPLAGLSPVTFNLALDLRTGVSLQPYTEGMIKVSSRGFESVAFGAGEAPYDHPLGLVFAIADHFDVAGLHIVIESASPPRSALGGSSAAAVALVCALASLTEKSAGLSRKAIALTAHAVEEGAARISCGLQDQLAAAYGGANAWYWRTSAGRPDFQRQSLLETDRWTDFNQCFLVAYGGIPHVSSDINGRWLDHFIRGQDRRLWRDIIACSRSFVDALAAGDLTGAIAAMNEDSRLRKQMTPDVFDDMGESLAACARKTGCGARFTGAGGGGCVWALGPSANIRRLKDEWRLLLETNDAARLLDTGIDTTGLSAPEGVGLID